MIALIRNLLGILDVRTRRGLMMAVPASVVIAFFETIGFALIFPFIQVLADDTSLSGEGVLADVYRWSGVDEPGSFLAVLGIGIFGALLLKAVLGVAFLRWQTGLLARGEAATASRLLRCYLEADYTFHLHRHSAELTRNVQVSVPQAFEKLLLPIVQILAEAFVVVAIVATLLVVDPFSALAAAGVLGLAGIGYLRTFGRRSRRLGADELRLTSETQQQVQEGLAGVKILHVLSRLASQAQEYALARSQIGEIRRRQLFASQLPRYLLEVALVLALGAIVSVVLLTSSGSDAIASLGLLAAGAFRLMPSLQRMLSASNATQVGRASAEMVVQEFRNARRLDQDLEIIDAGLTFDRELRLDAVSYTYPAGECQVLNNICLRVRRGESVGIVGGSGAGKTTLVDLLLGLLVPTNGHIFVDDLHLTRAQLPTWRKMVGYVPQDTFLFHDTLRRNVALGIDNREIDEEQVLHAIHLAQLDDVVAQLPLGIDTPLGERGLRLSGGQRQRVGIARALYGGPQVLVLDEATSSLDGVTETAITSTIERLHGDVTMVVVAHRLSTVQRCDRLVLFVDGRIDAVGTFNELTATSTRFATLVQAATVGPQLGK